MLTSRCSKDGDGHDWLQEGSRHAASGYGHSKCRAVRTDSSGGGCGVLYSNGKKSKNTVNGIGLLKRGETQSPEKEELEEKD